MTAAEPRLVNQVGEEGAGQRGQADQCKGGVQPQACRFHRSSPLPVLVLTFPSLAQNARSKVLGSEHAAGGSTRRPRVGGFERLAGFQSALGAVKNDATGNDFTVHGSSPGFRFGQLDACLHTEHIPGNIRAEILAADLATGQPLYRRAVLCGDTASFVLPLADRGFRNAKRGSESCLGADDLSGAVNGVVHA